MHDLCIAAIHRLLMNLILFLDRPGEARVSGPRQAIKGEYATLRCQVTDPGKCYEVFLFKL